jgi:hypothetical protein
MTNPIHDHRVNIRKTAIVIKKRGIYPWLIEKGYFPESCVFPRCRRMLKPPLYSSCGMQPHGGRSPKEEYMDCPNCGLVNPETAQRCDCGYDFGAKMVKEQVARTAVFAVRVFSDGNRAQSVVV